VAPYLDLAVQKFKPSWSPSFAFVCRKPVKKAHKQSGTTYYHSFYVEETIMVRTSANSFKWLFARRRYLVEELVFEIAL
jgi:hypothetical protein